MCAVTWLSPSPEPTDSDDVLVAVQAARAFERQGEIGDAVRWLRRAVDAAEQTGDDSRVLALARAAADLTSTMPPPGHASSTPPRAVSAAAQRSSKSPAPRSIAYSESGAYIVAEDMLDYRPAIRVSLARSTHDTGMLIVRRLRAGEPAPPGTSEALLVLTADTLSFNDRSAG